MLDLTGTTVARDPRACRGNRTLAVRGAPRTAIGSVLRSPATAARPRARWSTGPVDADVFEQVQHDYARALNILAICGTGTSVNEACPPEATGATRPAVSVDDAPPPASAQT